MRGDILRVDLATFEVQEEVMHKRLLVLSIVEHHGHRIGPAPEQIRRHDKREVRTRHLGGGEHTLVEEQLQEADDE